MIKESHELVNTPLYKVFPIFKPFAKILGRVEEETGHQDQRDELLDRESQKKDKKKKKQAPPQDEGEPDTLNYLGFGMVAYRDLMFTMVVLFAILSVIMIPAMTFYSAQGGITNSVYPAKYSLGNFGYSSSQCQFVPFQLNAIPINCPYGSIQVVNHVGVIPSTIDDKTICHVNQDLTAICPLQAGLNAEVLK